VGESIQLRVSLHGRLWRVDTTHIHDLSIPLAFDAPQPNFFGAPQASGSALTAGSFIGDVREGGSCNCATYSFTPHCNGTHTECVGHLTRERIGIRDIVTPAYAIARLVTLAPISSAATQERSDPAPRDGDELITRAALETALGNDALNEATALIVRTTPNPPTKQHRSYGPERAPPYFTAEFMRWIVAQGVQHLIVDLPSIDRAEDEGRLTAHRLFFGLPPGSSDAAQATRSNATVTELAFIDDAIPDGWYVLNLQIAPFVADAAPSRPLLMPLLQS
jgi:kynurenine formamidase